MAVSDVMRQAGRIKAWQNGPATERSACSVRLSLLDGRTGPYLETSLVEGCSIDASKAMAIR